MIVNMKNSRIAIGKDMAMANHIMENYGYGNYTMNLLEQKTGGFHMGTLIVGLILIVVIGIAIASMIYDKKRGKSLQCGGDCSKCRGCHQILLNEASNQISIYT